MEMNKLLEQNLDDRNRSLWIELSKQCDIKLEPSFEPNYISNFKDEQTTIFVDINKIESHSFTHELLHVKLKNNGMLASEYLSQKIQKSNTLNYIFSKNLEDHIGNCMEHVKMYPIFLNLGYKPIEFLSDFKTEKLSTQEVNKIKLNFSQYKIIDRDCLDFYIGKFFAAKACLSGNNYQRALNIMKDISPGLYNILREFWLDWLDFSLDEDAQAYEVIIDIFVDELDNWASSKTII